MLGHNYTVLYNFINFAPFLLLVCLFTSLSIKYQNKNIKISLLIPSLISPILYYHLTPSSTSTSHSPTASHSPYGPAHQSPTSCLSSLRSSLPGNLMTCSIAT
jgi:hypothetical protein